MNKVKNLLKNPWNFLLVFSLIDLIAFFAMILLLHPMWFSINEGLEKMLHVKFPWLFVIVVMLFLAISYLLSLFLRIIENMNNDKVFSLKISQKIIFIAATFFLSVMFYMLITGINQEISVAWREVKKVLPSLVFIFILAIVMLTLPVIKEGVPFRYRFFSFIALVMIFIIIKSDYTGAEISAGPYLQRVTSTSATIVVVTNKKSLGWLTIKGHGIDKKIQQSMDGMNNLTRVHRFTLENLKPGKKYNYQVSVKPLKQYYAYHSEYYKTISSENKSFKTLGLKTENISFLVFNDVHENSKLISSFIKKNRFSFDYLFVNGDYFDHIDSEKQIINQLLKPLDKALNGTKPFYFVRGNHETRGLAAPSLRRFLNKKNDNYYYAFSHGPIRFIVLDSGEDKKDSHKEYSGITRFEEYRKKELQWFKRETQRKSYQKARYRIILVHIPPYNDRTIDKDHGNYIMKKYFAPLFEKTNVDVVISGHTHKMAIFKTDKNHSYPVVVGGSKWDGETIMKVDLKNKKLVVNILSFEGKLLKSLDVSSRK